MCIHLLVYFCFYGHKHINKVQSLLRIIQWRHVSRQPVFILLCDRSWRKHVNIYYKMRIGLPGIWNGIEMWRLFFICPSVCTSDDGSSSPLSAVWPERGFEQLETGNANAVKLIHVEFIYIKIIYIKLSHHATHYTHYKDVS